MRTGFAAVLLTMFVLPAIANAQDRLPILAQNPDAATRQQSPWRGFYAGSELIVAAGKGAGSRIGGAAYAGYDRTFSNNVILGLRAKVGHAPGLFRFGGVRGYDFASTNIKLGYDLGRFKPYLTAGFGIAKASGLGVSGPFAATGSLNNLFNDSANAKTFTSVGAGFDYAITNRLSVGVAVSVGTAPGH